MIDIYNGLIQCGASVLMATAHNTTRDHTPATIKWFCHLNQQTYLLQMRWLSLEKLLQNTHSTCLLGNKIKHKSKIHKDFPVLMSIRSKCSELLHEPNARKWLEFNRVWPKVKAQGIPQWIHLPTLRGIPSVACLNMWGYLKSVADGCKIKYLIQLA